MRAYHTGSAAGLKRILLLCCAVAMLFTLAACGDEVLEEGTPGEAPQENANLEAAADFSMLDADGNTVSLSDFVGKPIVLNFWASWCGPCRNEMPGFDAAYAEYGDSVNFLVVNITDGKSETVETAADFIAEEGYSFPVYFDTALEGANAYSVSAIPVTYFINSDGYIVNTAMGGVDEGVLMQVIGALQ